MERQTQWMVGLTGGSPASNGNEEGHKLMSGIGGVQLVLPDYRGDPISQLRPL